MKQYITCYILLLCTFIAIFLFAMAIMCFIFWTIPNFKNIEINWSFIRILLILHNIPVLFVYFSINDPDKNI